MKIHIGQLIEFFSPLTYNYCVVPICVQGYRRFEILAHLAVVKCLVYRGDSYRRSHTDDRVWILYLMRCFQNRHVHHSDRYFV